MRGLVDDDWGVACMPLILVAAQTGSGHTAGLGLCMGGKMCHRAKEGKRRAAEMLAGCAGDGGVSLRVRQEFLGYGEGSGALGRL